MVAIVRALQDWEHSARLLVLDEPTATLPAAEVDRLFAVVRRVASNGLGVLFVSHRLDEVFDIASRVTVFRDGKSVRTSRGAAHSPDARTHDARPVDRRVAHRSGRVGRCSRRWSRQARRTRPAFVVRSRSTRVRSSALAGLLGRGRDEVAPLISGAIARSGARKLGGQAIKPDDPRAALRPESRRSCRPRRETARSQLHRAGEHRPAEATDPRQAQACSTAAERKESTHWIERARRASGRSGDSCSSTSAVATSRRSCSAKCLRLSPKVLLLDEPTQGVDVGAKVALYSIVAARAEEGLGSARLVRRLRGAGPPLPPGAGSRTRHRVVRELSGADLTAEAIDLAVLEEDRTTRRRCVLPRDRSVTRRPQRHC